MPRNNWRARHIEEEFNDSDGYWIYLKPGWCCDGDPVEHIIHEDTKAIARRRMKEVQPCNCEDCRKGVLR